MNKRVPLFISLITSLLVSYGFYSYCNLDDNLLYILLVTLFALLCSSLTLITAFVNDYETDKIKTVIRFVGSIFFALNIIVMAVLMTFTNSIAWLIIPMGILLMIYLSLIQFIKKSE